MVIRAWESCTDFGAVSIDFTSGPRTAMTAVF